MSRPPSPQARQLLADAVASQGHAWKNAANSILAGGWGNIWTNAALTAIDAALEQGPDDDDRHD